MGCDCSEDVKPGATDLVCGSDATWQRTNGDPIDTSRNYVCRKRGETLCPIPAKLAESVFCRAFNHKNRC